MMIPNCAMPLRGLIGGLIVEFGTRMGSGCTSGHGVCGLSRLSKRSVVATLCFMGSGVATVAAMNFLGFSWRSDHCSSRSSAARYSALGSRFQA